MARTVYEPKLRSRTSRRELRLRQSPYWVYVDKGRMFGYRKGAKGGVWLAKWSCPGDDKVRRQTTIGTADDVLDADGTTVLNFNQAQSKARDWYQQVFEQTTGKAIKPIAMTVTKVFDFYLENRKSQDEKSIHEARCMFTANIQPVLGHIDVSDLTRIHIEKWMKDLYHRPARVRTGKGAIEQPKRPLPTSEKEIRARKASVNRIWAILRAALNLALDYEIIKDDNAWRKVTPYELKVQPRTRFLNVQEQKRLVRACDAEFQALVRGALFTGARYGELTRISAQDFDPVSRTVFIQKGKGKDGGKSRHIVLTEEASVFFRETVIGLNAEDLIFTRNAHVNRNLHSQMIVRGWSKSEQFRLMKLACGKAGIGQMTFHELRHTYASGLVNKNVPLVFVAEQLGHSDIRMVERHYGHLCPSEKAAAIRERAPVLGIHESRNVSELVVGDAG